MLAKATGVSLRSVQHILEAHQLAPHRIRTFKLSKDRCLEDIGISRRWTGDVRPTKPWFP